jgi:hypothetical protein
MERLRAAMADAVGGEAKRGQGVVEYGLIALLFAIGVYGVLSVVM